MKSDFDVAALTYDQDFTHSLIGTAQRNQVWKYLDRYFDKKENISVLELNCGTGEDAIRFAEKGHDVVATDISEQMLSVARTKAKGNKVTFRKLDLNNVEHFELNRKFDIVFSNFGGLNCVGPEVISKISKTVSSLLKPEGKFIAIIMPQYCAWESFYFLLKGKWGEAFRRQKEYAIADVSNEKVKTFYFSPSKFERLGEGLFKRELLKPIGLFVPPSYLENFFRKRPALLSIFDKMDKALARFSWQAYISDHYYIQFTVR